MLTDIYKSFVTTTFLSSLKASKGVWEVKNPRKVSYGTVTNILRNNGLKLIEQTYDVYFHLASYEEFKNFADRFLAKLIPFVTYISEARDCDNLAEITKAMVNLFMAVNNVGKIHCTVYDATTGKKISGHYCNLVITLSNEVYLYDFNNSGRYGKYIGKDIVLGNWRYSNFDKIVLG